MYALINLLETYLGALDKGLKTGSIFKGFDVVPHTDKFLTPALFILFMNAI